MDKPVKKRIRTDYSQVGIRVMANEAGFNQAYDIWQKYHNQEIQRLTLSKEDIISIIDSCSDGHKYFDKEGIAKKIIKLKNEQGTVFNINRVCH